MHLGKMNADLFRNMRTHQKSERVSVWGRFEEGFGMQGVVIDAP